MSKDTENGRTRETRTPTIFVRSEVCYLLHHSPISRLVFASNLQFKFFKLLYEPMERRADPETAYSAWKADILAFELTAHNKTQDLHSL